MEALQKHRDKIVIDEKNRIAYILRELAKNPDYYVILSSLKSKGFEVKRVDFDELEKLKENLGDSPVKEKEKTVELSEVLKELESLIREAVNEKVSDIHIVSEDKRGEVKVRKNGMLLRVKTYSKEFTESMMRAFYQILKVAESNYVETGYQSAQFKREDVKEIDLPNSLLSIRVQRGPKLNGQFMVLRLLYRNTKKEIIEVKNESDRLKIGKKILTAYGYLPQQAREIALVARQGAGIGVIAGPTGSGKSTALKTILEYQHFIYPNKAIYTIEDPPEYPIEGAVQIPVVGEGREDRFVEALKVCMRSDPDIIMVGEVRDPATAKLSVDASLTGHQVWTTIHAVNSFAVFSRLEGLGISIEKLIETGVLKLIIAQRLIPKLCDNCKIPLIEGKEVDTDIKVQFTDIADLVFVRNKNGCDKCKKTGIIGRVVVAEVLTITEDILNLIKSKGPAFARKEWEKENVDMVKHSLVRCVAGEVDPHDVISIVGNFTKEDIEWAMQKSSEYYTSS